MADIETILSDNKFLTNQNANWQSNWQVSADYCLPRKANMNSIQSKGDRTKFNFLYDSTAAQSLQIMAAGFHSNLTNPSSRWFDFQPRRLRLMKSYAVRMWFRDVVDAIYAVINNSNFDTTMQEFYTNAGCFGTGCYMISDDHKTKVRFNEIPIEQLNIVEDMYGNIIAVYRNFKMTALQARREWGDDAGKAVLDKSKDKPYEMMDFIHYVGPRYMFDVAKSDAINMPFESVWISVEDKHLIRESGFIDMPYFVGRFYKDTNDVFGYSPMMNALCEVKGINVQKKTMLRAGMKATDPAHLLPSRGFMLPFNLNPNASNYYDPSKTSPTAFQTIRSETNFPLSVELLKMSKDDIEQAFFVPLFRSISDITKQMTIPEIQRRIAENMVLLGPVVGRFTGDAIGPSLLRVFNILWRNNELPEPPPELANEDFDIVYLSPLAKAQRMSEMNSLNAFMSTVGGIAQVKPSVLDKINEDEIIETTAEIHGIDPRILRDPREVKAIRDQRTQMQAQQAQLATMGQGAMIAKDAATAGKTQAEMQKVTVGA